MRKIRILFVIDKLDIGGAQRHILKLIKNINRDKFKPYLCCLLYAGELIEETKVLDIPVLILNIKRIYDFSGIIGLLKLTKFIREKKIDIVHTYLFSANILGNLAAKLAGVPLIISARRDTGIHREGKWQHRQAYKFAHRFADRVFVVSNSVRDIVHRYEGVGLDRILTIYNGIELGKQNIPLDIVQKRSELGLSEDENVVGMIANLTWVKGHKNFLEVAKLILQEMPNTKFLLIGEGPLRNNLESIVMSQQLENKIIFLGKRADIPELLSIMDVSVNASYSEGISNTILESMAFGVPVVATDVDGNKEVVINNKTGFLVPFEEIHAMKEKITYLLKNKDIAKHMGENAKGTVEKYFNLSVMVNRFEDTYINLLEEKYNGRYSS